MLSLLKWFIDTVDFTKIAEFNRGRNNRQAAARLYHALVISYDIIEIYEVLLSELRAALESHRKETSHQFFINPARIANLLEIQRDNLEKISLLSRDLYVEMRALSPEFASTYERLFSGKFGVLWDAESLLAQARLPLNEDSPVAIEDRADRIYRTAWFTWEPPTEDRAEIEKYLHGYTGHEKQVIDVNLHDGERFFRELDRYFSEENPLELLESIRGVTDDFKNALDRNFQLSDLLADLGKVKVRRSWAANSPKV